uniref:Uncharacterized protein n=1 Tax=Kalanchoe fedtschenkoi TaxID=63787 RepID=A0A7N0U7A1_KALFE
MGLFRGKGSSGFSSSSTAEEVTHGIDATGLTAIVTGGSRGIGSETARVLALRGAHVVVAVRNVAAGKATKEAIVDQIPAARVDVMELDLSSTESVRNFASEFISTGLPLHLLINNAGILAVPFTLSKDNIELQFATNHVGHFLLTHLLLDTMKNTARESNREGRVVIVASEAHRITYWKGIRFDRINDKSGYFGYFGYGQSKLANILHAKELGRRLKEEGADVTANALHPGTVLTNLFRHRAVLSGFVDTIGKIFMKDVHQGAATTCYVALHPQVNGVSGEYFIDCHLAKPNRQGNDASMAQKLWNLSMNLIS